MTDTRFERYKANLSSSDPMTRAVAARQLERLRARPLRASPASRPSRWAHVPLAELFAAQGNYHTVTAAAVLGRANGTVTKADRQAAKALNFGLLYGMGADTLRAHVARHYGVALSEREAVAFRATFVRTYAGLRRWHENQPRGAVDTRTLAGRRRRSVASFTRKVNTPVQGTTGDGMKLALTRLWEMRDQCGSAVPVLCVHDEIVIECDAAEAEPARTWLVDSMMTGMGEVLTQVPVVVEATIEGDWSGAEVLPRDHGGSP